MQLRFPPMVVTTTLLAALMAALMALLIFTPPAAAAPTTGEVQVAVILASFTDLDFEADHDVAYFEGLSFNLTGPSFRNFYLETSYGNLNLTGVVVEVNLSNTRSYYSTRGLEFIRDSAEEADPDIDYTDIDAIIAIHPGAGGESSGNSEDLWSVHYSGVSISTDERPFSEASIIPEYEESGGQQPPLGVMVHEFGHELHLPDLYDTDDSSEGIGSWGVMAAGSWNDYGRTPGHFGAWSKIELGWVTPTVITQDTLNVVLDPWNEEGTVYKLPIPANESDSQEFFLLTNRQLADYDSYLPGAGLLIWHVDDSRSNNRDETHKLVDLEEADGRNDLDRPRGGGGNRGDADDPWTGDEGSFTQTSSPNSTAYDGSDSGWRITEITLNGDQVSFDIRLFVPPVAVADAEKGVVLPGEELNFTGSDSYDEDGDIVSYDWDFGDGNSSSEADPTHAYATYGTYIVSLTVTDDDGANSTTTLTIYVNAPPVPVINVARMELLTGEKLWFNGTDSYDPDGTIFFWLWNFDDGGSSTKEALNHTFDDDGVYNVTLQVMDDRSTIATGYLLITVFNRGPVADMSADPLVGDTTTQFSFTFNGSDSDGTIATYFWDFADGSNSSLDAPSHFFEASGNYTVRLTVWDDDGAMDNASVNITITNAPPVVVIEERPSIWAAGEPLSLNGSGSYDPEGALTQLTWELSNGLNSTQGLFNLTLDPGNYHVWFNLTDTEQASTGVNWTLEVEPRPVALVAAQRLIVAVGQVVNLSGNGSNGGTQWSWDLGDGGNSTLLGNVSHAYATPGNYTVTLRITSPLELLSNLTPASQVTIQVFPRPVAVLALPLAPHHQWLPLVLNASGSQAGWGGLEYGYRIDSGAWTSYATNVTNVTHTLNPTSGGNHTFGLRVRDGNGVVDRSNATIYINWAPVLSWSMEPLDPEVGQMVNLTLELTDQDDNVTQFDLNWSVGDLVNLTLDLPANLTFNHTFTQEGDYDVRVELTLEGGARLSWTWPITVDPKYVEPVIPMNLSTDLRVGNLAAFSTSGGSPAPGDNTKLSALVSWRPGADDNRTTLMVEVEFTLDGSSLATRTITLEPGQEQSVSVFWTATKGSHTLLVQIDPRDHHNDTVLLDNQGSFTYTVQEPDGDTGGFLPNMGLPLVLLTLLLMAQMARMVRRKGRS